MPAERRNEKETCQLVLARPLDHVLGLDCKPLPSLHTPKRYRMAVLKMELRDVFNMLVGLKRSWDANGVREEPVSYGAEGPSESHGHVFFHDKLDVYQTALDVVRWAHGCGAFRQLPRLRIRDLDALLTSIVLNLAEGNGRFSSGDHRRFVETAHCAAIKAAAQLDIWQQKKRLTSAEVEEAHGLLVRVVSMTGALVENLRG